MIYPLIGPRLHGWLDDSVAVVYLAGVLVLRLSGAALAIAVGGAVVHFLLTRLTDYPQGTFKVLSFRTHAFVELGEGLAVLGGTALFVPAAPVRLFLIAMGVSQLLAFGFSDYRPVSPRP